MRGIEKMLAAKVLSDMMDSDDETPKHNLTLEQLVGSDHKAEKFEAGDIVTWKEGLSNKSLPKHDQNAVMMEVLDEPLMDTTAESASAYYRERLDVRLAVQEKGGDMLLFYFDSRRFKLVKRYEK